MAQKIIFQGDDKEIEIELTEVDNVTPADLTGVTEIEAKILDKSGNTVNTYSLSGAPNTDPITIVAPATDGKIRFKYQSAETLATPLGFVDIHGKVSFPDVAYDDGILDRIFQLEDEYLIKPSRV